MLSPGMGLTSLNSVVREEKPQCVICFQVLSNCLYCKVIKIKIAFLVTQNTRKRPNISKKKQKFLQK